MTDINRLLASLKRRSAHAKEFGHDVLFVKLEDLDALVEALEKAQQHIARHEQILLNQDESLSIRRGELEAAQQERDNWRTSFDNERFRADKLKAHIDDIEPVRAAAENLVRCKGRYHSEQNFRALAALFGVTSPDLPPLEHENVHYADAAEMEIAALRQRIAELEEAEQQLCAANVTLDAREELAERQLAKMESRAATVKLLKDHVDEADLFGWGVVVVPLEALKEACADAGVKVEVMGG
ncbi:ead/Ea22-like family protein [Klebsiella aerogenes]|uniref:ead/Ea22-like family protein n=1 Tax=Klebsiella sp. 141251 TaxID=3020030 RepID=UPI003D32D344